MRTAHIVTTEHEVGDRVLALCGKEHKVKTVWGDIPDETPICRDCVDRLILAVDEADTLVTRSRIHLRRLAAFMTALDSTVNPDGGLELDEIAEDAVAYVLSRQAKQKAKSTCTCTWTNSETRETDPNCPIHGGTGETPDVPEEGDQ